MSSKILVIDDEKNIRLMLDKCLSSEGYQVELAGDGISGIEKFNTEHYDVVLLDMKMPGLNGLEVLERLKDINSTISVIMMTAFGTIESAVEAMKLGAVDYIRKPFTPDIIRSQVKTVLSRLNLKAVDTENLDNCVQYAKKCITSQNYEEAKKYLMKALSFSTDNPEVYNLLGVLKEYAGDLHNAQKYYRMALCIDYSYEPANSNLQRTAQFYYKAEGIKLDNKENENEN